jgi:trehalose 6-phosphate phosphatase
LSSLPLLPNLSGLEQKLVPPEETGILTDADGTLSEISEHPSSATVRPGITDLLGRLHRRYGLVGVISGRRAAEAKALVGQPDIIYLGNHGLERVQGAAVEQRFDDGPTLTSAAKEELRRGLPVAEGLFMEDKKSAVALHYRGCRDQEAIDEAKRLAGRVAKKYGLMTQGGRRVIEVRPATANKGTALLQLARERQIKQVIYLGDDYTDMDAFEVLGRAVAESELLAVRVAVLAGESPPGLKESADYWVGSIDEVERFLEWLAER